MNYLKFIYQISLRKHGLYAFLNRFSRNGARTLDVGCGNDAAFNIKSRFPNLYYIGIDIGEYNQTKPNLADENIIVPSDDFHNGIKRVGNNIDMVISSHNLEHCDDTFATLTSMLEVLKENGVIYLAFPCESSINFPSRKVTLNYFDDKTHQNNPPNFTKVKQLLADHDCEIVFESKSYKPIILWIIGAIQEPFSRLFGKNMQGTWAYYGFESIIWAKKRFKA